MFYTGAELGDGLADETQEAVAEQVASRADGLEGKRSRTYLKPSQ